MDFLKLVRARYSVRQYQNRPVEPVIILPQNK